MALQHPFKEHTEEYNGYLIVITTKSVNFPVRPGSKAPRTPTNPILLVNGQNVTNQVRPNSPLQTSESWAETVKTMLDKGLINFG